MRYARRCAIWMLVLTLLAAAGAAAETGRVLTPRGPANMRKNADEKAPLVDTVPNHAQVEIEEMGEVWSRVKYKKQTGYIKTEFLRAPSQLIGQTVYADGDTVLIRKAAAEDAPVIGVLGCAEPVTVEAVEGDWLLILRNGAEGYVPADSFDGQRQERPEEMAWMTEKAAAAEEITLRAEPREKAAETGKIAEGQDVFVTAVEGDWCLAVTEEGCGWAPSASLVLTGALDTDDAAEGMTPNEAFRIARETLGKKYKAFGDERLYATSVVCLEQDGWPGPLYHVGFFNDQDQYRYGALISVETGRAVLAARYAGFAVPKAEEIPLLPQGEMELELSAHEMGVGDVVDITVRAWTLNAVRYELYLDGELAVKGKNSGHFSASYRPRQAGEYRLAVTVEDEDGKTATLEDTFTVKSGFVHEDEEIPLYSQKDGWWLDKKYRHSNLDKSGCAIFALSRALELLGMKGEETTPDALATAYATCLIRGEGTSNELLINRASKDFGFKTRSALYTDPRQIAALFASGAVFSFSPARGHIAMADGISEDSAMVHVVDSAPGATFERIKNGSLYYQLRSGTYRAAMTLDDLPGARWYFETEEYGGLAYWMSMDYIEGRGLRLIQPAKDSAEAKK